MNGTVLEFTCLMFALYIRKDNTIVYSRFAVFWSAHCHRPTLGPVNKCPGVVGVGHFISKALLLGVGEVACASNFLPFLCHNHNYSQVSYSQLHWAKQRIWHGSEAYTG